MSDPDGDSVSSSTRYVSREERLKRYKPGSIRRIKLQNFLTYSEVEFNPGPRLNVVIGPNGTGKSTILCAICLGLGGQPKLLGRSDDARLFIMHERDIATVEIEIAPYENQTVHVLKRVIDRNKGSTSKNARGKAASTYYINGREVKLADVTELVSETYKIAVENLCTFLPQDKVGSFSGFNAQELLIETEKSVSGTQHLYNQHQRLIKMEEDMLNSDVDLDTAKNELKKLEQQLESLEREKNLMEQRQDSVVKLQLYEQKYAWVKFDVKRKETVVLKDRKTELQHQLKEARKEQQPLRQKIDTLQYTLSQGMQRRVNLEREMEKAFNDHIRAKDMADKYQDAIDDVTTEIRTIDSNMRRARDKVKEHQLAVERSEAVLHDLPPMDELMETYNKSHEELRVAKRVIAEKRRETERAQMDMRNKKSDFENLKRNYDHMKDDKARRNENIFHRDPTLKRTYEWIDQNRKMFRRKIWGPIVCEIDTKDEDASNYLEQHVRNTVLKSYVVECKADYDLLFREMKQKRKWKINIQLIHDGVYKPFRRMYSDRMINKLKQEHGVVGFLDEVFEAPDAVMQALQSTSNIQQVLIGGAKTYESMNRKNLTAYLNKKEDGSGNRAFCIFAKDGRKMYKYTSTISRYGNRNASLSVDEIRPAVMLKPGVPPEEKERVQRQLQTVEEEVEQMQPAIRAATQAHDAAMAEAQDIQKRFNDAKSGRREIENAKQKVEISKRKLRDAQKDASKDNNTEKKRCVKKVKDNIKMFVAKLETSAARYDAYLQANELLAGIKMSEDGLKESLSISQQALQDIEHQTRGLEQQFRAVELEFKKMKCHIKQLKAYAVQLANIDEDDELREKLDEISDDINELDALIEDARDQIRSIQDNPQVLVQYEEQKKNFEIQKQELEDLADSKGLKRRELMAMKEPYQAALDNITNKVNSKFGNYMSELGCAGEVRLYKGEESRDEDVHNFKEWGIQIRVKFRETSDLQTLSAQVHSGGERSVSTIMYLMSMQDMMVSPFRCVDEINQGLDDRNERLVFRRIVQNSTTMPDNAKGPTDHRGQYFLITPKLLPNLTDMETTGVTVLCIFNGPFNFKHFNDWDVDQLIESRRAHKKRKTEVDL